MKKKIQEQVLKDLKKKWSNESQIGYSELAIMDAISRTRELMKKDTDEVVEILNKIHLEKLSKQKADFRKMIEDFEYNSAYLEKGIIDLEKTSIIEDAIVSFKEELLAKLGDDKEKTR